MKYQMNTLYNEDCLPAMKQMPDKYFDLAIVDPPYGGGLTTLENELGVHFHGRGRSAKYNTEKVKRTGGGYFEKYGGNNSSINHWDVAPSQEYFDELFRVSKNQIIWGGNYFALPPTRCFCVWRKLTISEKFTMAMCEYAWTSFNDNAKWIEIAPQGNASEQRFHPTQKPVALYTWLLNNYAKPGYKILDTHAGSSSSVIACHKLGYDWMAFEIDKTYYEKGLKRIRDFTAQVSMFDAFSNGEV